jgi:hypothetical protein
MTYESYNVRLGGKSPWTEVGYELDFDLLLNEAEEGKKYRNNMCVRMVKYGNYKIVKYDKEGVKSTDNPYTPYFRSIIFHNDEMVSFAPPKCVKTYTGKINDKNIEVFEEEVLSKIRGNESLYDISYTEEGTMINMFWNGEKWDIATRSNVGAKNFYNFQEDGAKPITFAQMFYEAFAWDRLNETMFKKDICYSFVLKHPANKMVYKYDRPSLILTNCYSIMKVTDNDKTYYDILDLFQLRNQCIDDRSITCNRPKQYHLDDKTCNQVLLDIAYLDVDGVEDCSAKNVKPSKKGIVIYNKETGTRVKVRSDIYDYVRELRGNNRKPMYNYLELRKHNKLTEYLGFYPEDTYMFIKFSARMEEFAQNLFDYYTDCFIKKTKHVKQYPSQYVKHMTTIHGYYLDTLRLLKKRIKCENIMEYVERLEPAQIMFALNYDKRPHKIENIGSGVMVMG